MLRLSKDGSCCYHQCDQNGHSVCDKVADHHAKLTRAVQALLLDARHAIPAEHLADLEAILAEDPDTSTSQ